MQEWRKHTPEPNVIWTRGINHSDYFWLINMGLHFTLPTSLLAYIMTCSGCVIFNLTIYCHVQVCLTTRWFPGTSSIWMSLIFSLQNIGFVTSIYGNIMFSDLQKCSCWWCKSFNLMIEKVFRSLVIMVENSYTFQFRINLEIWLQGWCVFTPILQLITSFGSFCVLLV